MKYVNFSGMCWPVPDEHTEADSVEWKLRYAPNTVDEKDRMYAASVINAYSSLIHKTIRQRNFCIKGIKEIILKSLEVEK